METERKEETHSRCKNLNFLVFISNNFAVPLKLKKKQENWKKTDKYNNSNVVILIVF